MNTYLVAAITLACILGTVLLLIFFYFIRRYLSLRTFERNHWLHALTPVRWRTPCTHCSGTACHSSEAKPPSTRESAATFVWGSADRRNGGDAEWYVNGRMEPRRPDAALVRGREESDMRGGRLQRPQHGTEHGTTYPQARFPQSVPYGTPAADQRQYQPHGIQTPSQIYPQAYPRRHRSRTRSTHGSPSISRPAQHHNTHRAPRVRQTDFIHIVDQYPPIIQEALDREKQQKKSASRKRAHFPPPSARSSTSSDATEEVPRASIPKATPRFAASQAQKVPEYPGPYQQL